MSRKWAIVFTMPEIKPVNTDYTSGTIIAALDGTLSVKEVLEILLENNKDVSSETLTEKLVNIFESLLKEEFLDEIN